MMRTTRRRIWFTVEPTVWALLGLAVWAVMTWVQWRAFRIHEVGDWFLAAGLVLLWVCCVGFVATILAAGFFILRERWRESAKR